MPLIRISPILILTLGLVGGCQGPFASAKLPQPWTLPRSNPESVPDTSRDFGDLRELNVAVIPDTTLLHGSDRVKEFDEYLEQSLGIPVVIQVTENYDQTLNLLVKQQVAMAYLGSFSYLQATIQNPTVRAIATHIHEANSRPWYTSVIIANQAKGIQKLADLRGKTFGFVDPLSTSGFLVPKVALQEKGLNPNTTFKTIEFLGSHNRAIDALIAGKVDGIAVDSAVYQSAILAGDLLATDYPVLWESDPIPNPPIAVNGLVNSNLEYALKQSLITAPPRVAQISGDSILGYTLANNEDYDNIREVIRLHQLALRNGS